MPSDYNDTGIATGAIANIQNGADCVPIKSWIVNIDPNLTGESAVECTQAGKNLLAKDIVRYSNSLATLSDCFAIRHGTYTVTIGTVANANNWRLSVLLMDGEGNALTDNIYRPSNDLQLATNRWRYGSNTSTKVYTINIVADCYIRIFIELGDTSSSTTITDSQLELGSTASTYEPYTAPIVSTVNLGRTIYGGQADVVNGTGKSKFYKQTYTGDDLSSVSLTYGQADEGYTHLYFYITGIPIVSSPSAENVLSDIGVPYNVSASSAWVPSTECFNMLNTGNAPNQRPTFYWYTHQTWASVDAFKTWLNANPITVVYKVEDETDFTFTPITPTPETALGTNNFWADEGDSELTYYKDGYGFTSVTVHKETPDGEPMEETRKFHRIIYEGQVDVISGTGLIYIGESGTEYDPPEEISFTPIDLATEEGENTFYADEGVSVITYRRGVE